jgi:hypothetical protein
LNLIVRGRLGILLAMRFRHIALALLVVVGCRRHSEPDPIEPGLRPQPQQQQPPPAFHPPWTEGSNTSKGGLTGNPEMPIDPAKPMPARSLSTDTGLELGKPATVLVDGRADIYSAGLTKADERHGGTLPVLVTLVGGGGYVTFSAVKGVVGCMAGATTPADGGNCAGGNTDITAANGISGIVDHQHTQFLVGVFLGPLASSKAPATLDFSEAAQGESFAELAPLIGQTFFIGDGSTKSGLNQRFVIPAGASRFYLAFADAFSFQGTPGAYGDNTGGLAVTLTQAK